MEGVWRDCINAYDKNTSKKPSEMMKYCIRLFAYKRILLQRPEMKFEMKNKCFGFTKTTESIGRVLIERFRFYLR